MPLSRRDLLKLVAAAPAPLLAPRLATAATSGLSSDILICIFLAGGVDGLHLIAPYGDSDYYRQRGKFALDPPGSGTARTLSDLNGFFGLHPAMASLLPFYGSGMLGIVHAVGSPHSTHSHFDAQLYMQGGMPGVKGVQSGWLGRHLAATSQASTPFQTLSWSDSVALTLRGPLPAMAMSSISALQVPARWKREQIHAVADLFDGTGLLDVQMLQGMDAATALEAVDPTLIPPENGAVYPASKFGREMREIGQMIKADLGVATVHTTVGGWDTHAGQDGTFSIGLQDLADTLAAFATDMGSRMANVTLVLMSEFGRRVRPNASGGTDHGHGGCMLALGGGVQGGQVYGAWPGLSDNALYGPGDLAVTTDFRTVLGELLVRRFGNTDLNQVFPDFQAPTFLGMFA